MVEEERAERYASVEDAVTRLNGTLVLLFGKPVLLSHIDGYQFSVSNIDPVGQSDLPKKINVNTQTQLSFDIPPLGYVNVNSDDGWEPAFVQRMPYRRFMQGLCHRNTVTSWDCRDVPVRRSTFIWENPSLLVSCFTENYPTFSKAIECVQTNQRGLAFHKNFALARLSINPQVVRLRYMSNTIGVLDGTRIELLPGYQKYEPFLQKVTNG
jgi:hypothetical protein